MNEGASREQSNKLEKKSYIGNIEIEIKEIERLFFYKISAIDTKINELNELNDGDKLSKFLQLKGFVTNMWQLDDFREGFKDVYTLTPNQASKIGIKTDTTDSIIKYTAYRSKNNIIFTIISTPIIISHRLNPEDVNLLTQILKNKILEILNTLKIEYEKERKKRISEIIVNATNGLCKAIIETLKISRQLCELQIMLPSLIVDGEVPMELLSDTTLSYALVTNVEEEGFQLKIGQKIILQFGFTTIDERSQGTVSIQTLRMLDNIIHYLNSPDSQVAANKKVERGSKSELINTYLQYLMGFVVKTEETFFEDRELSLYENDKVKDFVNMNRFNKLLYLVIVEQCKKENYQIKDEYIKNTMNAVYNYLYYTLYQMHNEALEYKNILLRGENPEVIQFPQIIKYITPNLTEIIRDQIESQN
jgi:hypothetical protein